MKIVYITNESYLDHSYTVAKQLAKKETLIVYILAREGTEEIKRWCSLLNASFIKRKRYRNPLSFFAELKFILSVKKHNADCVWFNTLNFYQLLLVKLLLKRFLVMVHDVEFHPELKDPFAAFSVKLTFALLKTKLCTASETQASIYEKRYGFKPLVFQLPVIDYFSDIARPKVPEKRRSDIIRFFFFGSIKRYKGIETLIEAAEILESRKAKYEINIYGKFRYEAEELISRLKKLRNVKLKNEFIRFDEISGIYLQNDVLILPYKHVTQCGPLLIGFNELVPSICSDLPGFREYVKEGKSGLLFDNSARGLADKMMLIINNKVLISGMKEFIKTETFRKYSMENLLDGYIKNLSDI
jgi:glycosyltransferase involved in cell wall biosynthesis